MDPTYELRVEAARDGLVASHYKSISAAAQDQNVSCCMPFQIIISCFAGCLSDPQSPLPTDSQNLQRGAGKAAIADECSGR